MNNASIEETTKGSQVFRLHNLDYLRGLAAFGIMLYHYFSWSQGKFTAETFMGRLGIYGVSIFYVLSGLTLYYVYFNKMVFSSQGIKSFFQKRILRIFPLLWLVTIVAVVLSRKLPNPYDFILNITGLFGFIKWDTYFSPGVWSIGNELVFYTLFPFFILFAKSNKLIMALLSVVLFILYLYFCFFSLTPSLSLSEQWSTYINPLNQAFLFLGGFLIGLFFHKIRIDNIIAVGLLLLGLGLFILTPVSGDPINLVTGWHRLIFTFSSFLICLGFYKFTLEFPNAIHKPLVLLGETSYSLYLLHPIVWSILSIVLRLMQKGLGLEVHNSVKILSAVIITIIVSYFTYRYFEKYFMGLGRLKVFKEGSHYEKESVLIRRK